jgi:hypothetical protein
MRLQLSRNCVLFLAILATSTVESPLQAQDKAQDTAQDTAPDKGEKAADKAPPPQEHDIDVRAGSEAATYSDSDHVWVVSPSIHADVSKPTAGWSVGGRYLVDVVSAASVDIVSTASRRFDEVRHAGTLDGSYQLGSFTLSANADVSIEPDYQSYVGSASLTKDLLDKNLTLLVGYHHGYDIAGRSGTPFDVWNHQINDDGFKLGGTLLLDRATLLSVVGDLILENGDTSKPYRYVPLFAPGVDVPRGASIDTVTQLRLSARALEQLPTSRQRYAMSARLAHRFEHATLRFDERGYVDSWGLKATTTDGRLLFDPWKRVELGPHLRFHAQTPVDFWQRAYTLRPGNDFPALRTGDRELGPIVNVTAGGTLHLLVGPDPTPRRYVLGLDVNVTSTSYLDDIYISQRTSGIAALIFEVEL